MKQKNNEVTEHRVRAFRRFAFSWSNASIGEFDDVEDLLVGTVDGGAGAELQQAAGVGGDDGLPAGGLGVAHFLGEQFEGSSGMTTSQPLAVRTRMVASLSCEKVALATQSAKKATRARRGPAAGQRPAEAAEGRDAGALRRGRHVSRTPKGSA